MFSLKDYLRFILIREVLGGIVAIATAALSFLAGHELLSFLGIHFSFLVAMFHHFVGAAENVASGGSFAGGASQQTMQNVLGN